MAPLTRDRLIHLREIQGVHGPNMCMASSKFLALKLAGLVNPDKHLNNFLHSRWAERRDKSRLANCWGWTLGTYNDEFNRDVLPPALNDPTAEVKNNAAGNFEARYCYFHTQPAVADQLLKDGVPLVVAVSIHDTTGQDHHIVVVKGKDGTVWAVDPWPGDTNRAVQKLPANFSFSRVTHLHMTADANKTRIPCHSQLVGYFRDSDLESRYSFQVQE